MLFTTQIFLFLFFPISLIVYLLCDLLSRIKIINKFIYKYRVKDLLLISFSFVFYMWSSVSNLPRLMIYILLVYILGLWVQKGYKNNYYLCLHQSNNLLEDKTNKQNQDKQRKFSLSLVSLIVSITIIIFYLVHLNYHNFLLNLWNFLVGDTIPEKSLIAPLGLSFITFSSISYLVDIHRGQASAGNIIDFALYLSFFPKVISGPIVLWKDFKPQISKREISIDGFTEGINRIMIGFSKKVILADSFGATLAEINLTKMDSITAFGTMVLYMLQIYYDFAGYSDIAIGLARIFGFHFKENFNFPYRSKSISEFWRRWHISLGTWFKEYIYIPLGGSRVNKKTTLRNLLIIFVLTGLWHGAGWNYILWGLINATFVIIEHLRAKRDYGRIRSFFKYISTMMVVFVFWQFFKYHDLKNVFIVFKTIFKGVSGGEVPYTYRYYFDLRTVTFILIGIFGATLLGSDKVLSTYTKLKKKKIFYILQELILISLFIISILFMINSNYSPFIYFQY